MPYIWVWKEGSPLANPFSLQQYTREECLNKYRSWLVEQLNDINSPQSIELNRLTELVLKGQDINLICFCKPKDCHGDIIKEFILKNQLENA